jgi:hypothetical protein
MSYSIARIREQHLASGVSCNSSLAAEELDVTYHLLNLELDAFYRARDANTSLFDAKYLHDLSDLNQQVPTASAATYHLPHIRLASREILLSSLQPILENSTTAAAESSSSPTSTAATATATATAIKSSLALLGRKKLRPSTLLRVHLLYLSCHSELGNDQTYVAAILDRSINLPNTTTTTPHHHHHRHHHLLFTLFIATGYPELQCFPKRCETPPHCLTHMHHGGALFIIPSIHEHLFDHNPIFAQYDDWWAWQAEYLRRTEYHVHYLLALENRARLAVFRR